MKLEICDVSKQYKDKCAVDHANLTLTPGVWGLLGANGAGKTTLMRMIAGIMKPTGGEIRYDGIDITKIRKDDLRRSLGIVLQDTHLFTGTVRDNIRFGKLDAPGNYCWQAFCQVAMERIIWPQD